MESLLKYHLFPYKVWLSTLLFGPIIFFSLTFFKLLFLSSNLELSELFRGIVAAFYVGGIGLVFSLPCLAVYLIAFYICSYYVKIAFIQKLICTVVTIIGIVLSLSVLDFDISGSDFWLIASYTVATAVFHMIFKLSERPVDKAQPITEVFQKDS